MHLFKHINFFSSPKEQGIFQSKSAIENCLHVAEEDFAITWSNLTLEQKTHLIAFEQYYLFSRAIEEGKTHLVDTILNHISKQDVYDEFDPEEGFKIALEKQHIDIIERILLDPVFYTVCLDHILASEDHVQTILDSRLSHVIILLFNHAIKKNLKTLKRLLKRVPQNLYPLLLLTEKIYLDHTYAIHLTPVFQVACENGNINLLKFIWEMHDAKKKQKLINIQFPLCMMNTVKNANLTVFKKLLEWLTKDQQLALLSEQDFLILCCAVENGHNDIIKLIWEHIPTSERINAITANDFALYRLAKINNHLSTVALLEALVPPHLRGKMVKSVS